MEKSLAISDDVFFPAYFYVSSKANGSFEIGNVIIKAYDAHPSPKMYIDYLLKIKMIDVNFDGYRDLLIYGMEEEWGDKEWYPKVGSRLLFFLFLYNPDEGEFEFTYTNIPPDEYGDYFFFCKIDGKKITKYIDADIPAKDVKSLLEEFPVDKL